MKKFTGLLICVLLTGFCFKISGQALGNMKYNEQNRYINQVRPPVSDASLISDQDMIFEVNAIMNVQADNYVAVFHIIQIDDSVITINKLMNSRINGFIKGLKGLGIDSTNIFIDMISFVPVFSYKVESRLFSKTYNEVPAGFELQKNVHITYKNGQMLDKIISVASQNEIYDLVKVDYYIENTQKAYEQLHEKAVQFLETKLKLYSQLGFKFDTLTRIISDKEEAIYPITRYSGYQAFSRPSLQAMQQKSGKGLELNVSETYKPNSMYYNPVPYDNYDVVINPLISQPLVQLTYNLKVKYSIREKPKKLEKHYFILTPQGDVKTLDVR